MSVPDASALFLAVWPWASACWAGTTPQLGTGCLLPHPVDSCAHAARNALRGARREDGGPRWRNASDSRSRRGAAVHPSFTAALTVLRPVQLTGRNIAAWARNESLNSRPGRRLLAQPSQQTPQTWRTGQPISLGFGPRAPRPHSGPAGSAEVAASSTLISRAASDMGPARCDMGHVTWLAPLAG
jgi:hypothetical protein